MGREFESPRAYHRFSACHKTLTRRPLDLFATDGFVSNRPAVKTSPVLRGANDVALRWLLRRDERVDVHRISLAKKTVARLRMSRSSRRMRISLRNWASSARSPVVSPSR
jgi:hypothetical protein